MSNQTTPTPWASDLRFGIVKAACLALMSAGAGGAWGSFGAMFAIGLGIIILVSADHLRMELANGR